MLATLQLGYWGTDWGSIGECRNAFTGENFTGHRWNSNFIVVDTIYLAIIHRHFIKILILFTRMGS